MLTNLRVSLLNLWRYNRALLGVQDPSDPEFAVPVSRAAPLPVEVIGGSVGGGGGATHAGVPLDPEALWNTGYTPAQDGTLLIQNLCRDCYFEAYTDQPPMLADPPEGTTPVISVAPESWARVPVQAGQTLSLVMHGYVAAPHFHEVRLHVLPGVTDLAGGPMPRHPESVAGLPARTSLVLTDQAQGLPDIPEGATAARIAVEGGVARVATAAPEPTANDGERWGDGSVWQISGRDDLLALRAVTASGAPKLSITYTKGVSITYTKGV